MKTIKLFLVLSIFMVNTISFAQPQGGRQGGQQGPPPIPNNKQIKKMVSNLADEIELSKAQETKVLKLYKAHFVEVKEKISGNSRPKREEMEALDKTLQKNVIAELSKEQISKYEAYQKKQEKKRPKR